ncbi:DegT/DnrJ/EryC1/StrS family aminotransferase [Halomicrobium zhouii]|uniref:DegT/DnrJ/EryC1/StrS family aminotransferase n=1 Tax=Halomicrobium zhouii TaxID=767519 RepID=UPI000B7D0F71|nr:aminotransferase class I/II-fold pyridoxal phosphate-dependent enzyme [Halomicrobium zhouii]
MTSEKAIDAIRPLVEEHFERKDDDFVPGESTIQLSRPTFGPDEVTEAVESLLSTFVTMGEKVDQFEEKWSDYVDTRYSHMVNSGSSANLLALKALQGDVIEPGDEVIVPAVAWSTSLFPIVDIGAAPVLVDIDPETYTIDPEAFENAISDRTEAVVLVHLLGNPCDLDSIVDICDAHDITIVEDCCEAHGARYDGQDVGTFGDVGTYSFFFSHHISTIEGGMVITDDETISERVRMARAHGWIRELDDTEDVTEAHPDIDPRFLFASHGYNLRPTEIQGAFGIHQVDKLDQFVKQRRQNAAEITSRLSEYDDVFRFFEEDERAYCSWFAYPFQVRESAPFSRDDFQRYLEENNIETRPILAGNLARQPILEEIDHRVSGALSGAQQIHDTGLFIGNHHRLDDEMIDYIVSIVEEYVESQT